MCIEVIFMDTRVNKYDNNKRMSRVSKNEELYKEINASELDDFQVGSNATVIGNQEEQIDIEKLKSILDKRYNSTPKRRSIRIEPKEVETKLEDETTKEYDLKVVLEKAKDEKEESYEDVRAKKLRNTQFDILSNLKIDENKYKNEEMEEDITPKDNNNEDLMNLINTITINEAKKKESSADPLDILSDLKGDDNSQVYEGMAEELAKQQETPVDAPKEAVKGELDKSFYTHDLFKKKDFEDGSNEFVEDEKLSIGIKILIVLVIIVFAVGLILFLKSFL